MRISQKFAVKVTVNVKIGTLTDTIQTYFKTFDGHLCHKKRRNFVRSAFISVKSCIILSIGIPLQNYHDK